MGRDVAGIRTNTKLKPVKPILDISTFQETAHVSPKVPDSSPEYQTHKTDSLLNEPAREENENLKDVSGTKKIDSETDYAVAYPQANENEALASTATPSSWGGGSDSTDQNSTRSKDMDMPAKELQNPPRETRKALKSDRKKRFDEEYNFSVTSSCNLPPSKSSVKTYKFRTTIPVAPVFTCVERLEKRKQFYSKLEEKQAATEAERLENEAKIKEKEQEIIRQLRKSMVYKANPVPSFYREGHPPKPQLKKIPVTRAKSPKLSRRRSCSDVMSHSSPDEKGKENRNSSNRTRTSASPFYHRVQIGEKKSLDCSETKNPTPHAVSEEKNEEIVVSS